jgi:hypothetical protein
LFLLINKVSGNGYSNEYKLKTNINAKINLNSSYTTSIEFYNPNNETLKITEIFTSDDDLHLELPVIKIINYTVSSDDYQVDSEIWVCI